VKFHDAMKKSRRRKLTSRNGAVSNASAGTDFSAGAIGRSGVMRSRYTPTKPIRALSPKSSEYPRAASSGIRSFHPSISAPPIKASTIATAVVAAVRRPKKRPKCEGGTRSRIQEFQAQPPIAAMPW
jgi:hypothetical protein